MAAFNSFGLDIGTQYIKVVQLSKDGKNVSLRSCLSVPLPGSGMVSESSFDLEEVAQTIRKLVNDANINTNNVHTALPDSSVYTKVVEIPQLSDKDLQAAIYWEAEQNIPAPLATITLSWQMLRKRETATDSLMDVFLVGAPTNLVKKYQNVLEMAGLTPLSLETEIISVVRSLGLTPNSPTTLIANISGFSTALAIVQKGLLVFTYAIPLGGMAINRAISTEFGFSDQQAEEYKRVYGVADKQVGGKIAHAIEPILQSMSTEMRKAVAFYNGKYLTPIDIQQVILAGPTGVLPGIDLFFVQSLGIETVTANPWKMCNIGNVPENVMNTSTDYSLAVGLALKDYEQ